MRMPSRQRGMTLVELMIGMAIGLLIVATGASLLVGQLRENRGMVQEARMTQDLRIAADMVARDLRRAGYRGGDGTGASTYTEITLGNTTTADGVALRYSRDATENNVVDSNEQFGFRLRSGAIELQLGAGNWQALTDATLFTVTAFTITPQLQDINLGALCASACTPGSNCPPHQQIRSFGVSITATLNSDASVSRSAQSQARVRADAITGACAG